MLLFHLDYLYHWSRYRLSNKISRANLGEIKLFSLPTNYGIAMNFSDENSDSSEESDFDEDILLLDGENIRGFAFEPEYSEDEIEKRLREYLQEKGDNNRDNEENISIKNTNEGLCKCGSCVVMQNAFEQVCCKSSEIIQEKIGDNDCITKTEGFQVVCLNKNVLDAAFGTWYHETDENLERVNRSFRFIAYRQYISWVFGYLGKDVRKVIPSCAVSIIRNTFPAADNIYVPYKDN